MENLKTCLLNLAALHKDRAEMEAELREISLRITNLNHTVKSFIPEGFAGEPITINGTGFSIPEDYWEFDEGREFIKVGKVITL